MGENKTIRPEERLSTDLKRFGAPYSGESIQTPVTEKQLSAALISMIECLEQNPLPNNTEEAYTDTDLFL